jgi:hypothetical protein
MMRVPMPGQYIRDEEVAKTISGAPEFAGASMVLADVVTRIDAPSLGKSTTCIAIFKRPSNRSTEQLYQEVAEVSDAFAALPTAQMNMVNHTVVRWRSS